MSAFPPYRTSWVDHGQTADPCPKACGSNLRWAERFDSATKKTVRFLACSNAKKCGYKSEKSTPRGNVRGVVDIERLNARAR